MEYIDLFVFIMYCKDNVLLLEFFVFLIIFYLFELMMIYFILFLLYMIAGEI